MSHSLENQRRSLGLVHAFAIMMSVVAIIPASTFTASAARAASFSDVIRDGQRKSVKIYGAGGLRGLESYQSGFLISAEGHILTVFSHVLDSDTITVTLDDGRKFDAQLVGADPRLEIAVLKIDATDLPCFDLNQQAPASVGTRVLTFSNLFGVATGDESVSVLHGSVAAVSSLAARRGAFETPYQGPVYVLDAMTNNPGAAGGALTNMRGQLLGILGKQLRSSRNNTWLNFAIPIHELTESVANIEAGKSKPDDQANASKRSEHPLVPADLGLVLVPNVLERTPPFIDDVHPDSPAAKAGLRADDLVVMVNNQLVQSCQDVMTEIGRADRDAEINLEVVRDGELMQITVKPSDSPSTSDE